MAARNQPLPSASRTASASPSAEILRAAAEPGTSMRDQPAGPSGSGAEISPNFVCRPCKDTTQRIRHASPFARS